MGTRAADVEYAADLPASSVRIEVGVAEGREETKKTGVGMNDLHATCVALRYPGSGFGQEEAGQGWVQS